MDITQTVLVISLILVTGVITASGVWLIMILKEFKTTIVKTNSILDDAKLITESVAEPVSSVSQFVMGFKNGLTLFNSFFNKKDKDN